MFGHHGMSLMLSGRYSGGKLRKLRNFDCKQRNFEIFECKQKTFLNIPNVNKDFFKNLPDNELDGTQDQSQYRRNL